MKQINRSIAVTLLLLGAAAATQACGDDDAVIPDADGGVDAGKDSTVTPPADSGRDVVTQPPIDATPPPVDATPNDAASDATADADADAGTVGDGGNGTLEGGTCDGGALSVSAVTPQFGATTSTTAITVSGQGFQSLPRVFLVSSTGVLTAATNASFVSQGSVTAIVPAGLAVGTYAIAVVNPGECSGRLAGSFDVVANPPPLVLGVTPAQGTTQTDVPVTVTGCNFPANATLSTLDAAGTVVVHTTTAAPVAGAADPRCNGGPLYTLAGTIETKTKALVVGAYVVRVTNPTENTFGDYSAFVVSNPSGNLSGGWQTATTLLTGRRSLALAAARLDDAHRFLYAIGGETAAGVPLSTVEVAALDRFGNVGPWTKLGAELKAARSGLSVVSRGLYLYALGGTSSNDGTRAANNADPSGTPLATVERAKLLEPSGAPKLQSAVASTTGGTLAAGAYYYRVAAVLDATVPLTQGETLPSEELVAELTAAGTIKLTWTAPAVGSVASYRIYRTKPGAASGEEVLLAENVTGTTYDDTGAATSDAGTAVPLALGATGPWVTTTSSLAHARLSTSATTATDPLGARFLFVVGGWGQCAAGAAAAMNCWERAPLSDDGATLGAFTAGVTTMGRGRMGLGTDALTSGTTSFVVSAGGKGANAQAQTVESAAVLTGGVLDAWANPGGFSGERDGTQLLIANGRAYAFLGGGAPSYSQTSDQSALASVVGTTLTFANWSNAGANFSMKIGRHGMAAESAYFYIAGGTTNDTDALTGVYRILH